MCQDLYSRLLGKGFTGCAELRADFVCFSRILVSGQGNFTEILTCPSKVLNECCRVRI